MKKRTKEEMIKNCENCNNQFKAYWIKLRFCSNSCSVSYTQRKNMLNITKRCLYCNKEYTRPPSSMKNSSYCSHDCMYKALYSTKSSGNIKLKNLIEDFGYKVELEVKLIPNRRFRYDIYCKDLNLVIEYHGIQHYKWNKFFDKTKDSFNSRREIDRIKKEYCLSNSINYIEWPYTLEINCKNFIESWNFLRDQDTTTNEEIQIVNVLKNLDIGKSAAELLKKNYNEEGSTTIENMNKIISYLEVSRVDFINKIINKVETQSIAKQ